MGKKLIILFFVLFLEAKRFFDYKIFPITTTKLLKLFYISKFPNGISPKILVFQDNLHKFAEKNAENLQKSKIFRIFAQKFLYTMA